MSKLSTVNTPEANNKKDNFFQKLEGGKKFKLTSPFSPAGDQPTAIKQLREGLLANQKNQVLLGVTGSGKTFTMAKIIEELNRPAIILAPNKTLAAQLYGEMKSFFSRKLIFLHQQNICKMQINISMKQPSCQLIQPASSISINNR